jgi:RHS repeat-associated protein
MLQPLTQPNHSSAGLRRAHPQYAWPGQRADGDTDCGRFCHQGANWNVLAWSEYDDGVGTDGRFVERYAYTPYGEFIVLKGDPDGGGEHGGVLGSSQIGNVFFHQGLPYDAEKLSYQNRHREYVARLQRFAQRDPLEYVDGVNTYCCAGGAPTNLVDPLGTDGICNQTFERIARITRWRCVGVDEPCPWSSLRTWMFVERDRQMCKSDDDCPCRLCMVEVGGSYHEDVMVDFRTQHCPRDKECTIVWTEITATGCECLDNRIEEPEEDNSHEEIVE